MEIERHHSTIDGIRIARAIRPVRDDPNAPTIAFLHGLGSAAREFHQLAGRPAFRGHTLHFLDAPGHGTSDRPPGWSYSIEAHADALAALLYQVAISPITLVGHSMGGSIGIAMAIRHPGLISRLVVAEPNLDPAAGNLSGHVARQSEGRFVERGYRALTYQTRREASRGDLVAARFLITLQQASPVAIHRSAVSLRADRSPTFREQLEGLAIPRTVIWGERTSPLVPPLLDPAITHEVIADAGHVMMVDNPEGFAAAVSRAAGDTKRTVSS